MIINLDVDGVIRDIAHTVLQIYKEFHDSRSTVTEEDIKQHNLTTFLPLIKSSEDFFVNHHEQIFYNAKPYNGAKNLVVALKDRNHTINIVTSQYKGTEISTLEWLLEHNIEYDSIIFTNNKNIVEGDLLIDDNIKNLSECNKKYKICFARPWNTEYSGLRVDSYKGCLDLVKYISNKEEKNE